MTKTGYIYGLFDPDEPLLLWNCHYIGQTKQRITARLKGHILAAENAGTSDRDEWIRGIIGRSDNPEPIIRVFEFSAYEDLDDREIAWIAEGRRQGWALTNTSPGGGIWVMTPEIAAKVSRTRIERQIRNSPESIEKMRQSKLGTEPWNKGLVGVMPETTRAKIREARAKQVITDETRAKLSIAGKGRVLTEEHKAKISVSHVGISPTPEVRARISATLTGRKNGPPSDETRKKISVGRRGKLMSEESKEQMRASANRRWEDPEQREKARQGTLRYNERKRAERAAEQLIIELSMIR